MRFSRLEERRSVGETIAHWFLKHLLELAILLLVVIYGYLWFNSVSVRGLIWTPWGYWRVLPIIVWDIIFILGTGFGTFDTRKRYFLDRRQREDLERNARH